MNNSTFERFCAIAYERAGIHLNSGKEALVAARVSKRMRSLGLGDEAEYLRYLEADPDDEEIIHFLDAISTNFTSFFREPDHFERLTIAARAWRDLGRRTLRVWSAASSSGQEPYSIAVTLAEALGADFDFKVLATDISTRMLDVGRAGSYPASAVATVPKALLAKWFERDGETGHGEKSYHVRPEIAARVVFSRLNLATVPYPMKGPLDAVFCRNVMIYFDRPVRQALVREIERLLGPGGLLMIGHTETLTGLSTGLRLEQASVFTKAE
jgi:chemotaxis protein methyltransferase CheR